MDKLTYEEMLLGVEKATPIPGRNSMGVSESYYDPYYLVNRMLKEQNIDISTLSERELRMALITANFASDVFY